jgi:hypothetical protein
MRHHDQLSKVATLISSSLNRSSLARVSGNTFSPACFAAIDGEVEHDISWLPKLLDIRYVDYHPNRQTAGAICEQLLFQSHTRLIALAERYANRSLMNIEAHLLWDRL